MPTEAESLRREIWRPSSQCYFAAGRVNGKVGRGWTPGYSLVSGTVVGEIGDEGADGEREEEDGATDAGVSGSEVCAEGAGEVDD